MMGTVKHAGGRPPAGTGRDVVWEIAVFTYFPTPFVVAEAE
jgi:hypothetical protein